MLRLTDLREILRYVPRFRDKVFVIAIDGVVVETDNFGNLLLDIALLRSLRVGVVLVHGASHQIRKIAAGLGVPLSNDDGTGVTDDPSLQVAITAANRVSHEILEGLAANDLRAAVPNALVAHPAGILGGVDHQFTGKIDRIDTGLLQTLMEHDIVPVISPLGCDGQGRTFRLNSDTVAVEIAKALKAVKLIFLTDAPGIRVGGKLMRQLATEEADAIVKRHRAKIKAGEPGEVADPQAVSKLEQAVRAARLEVPRIHIIDGRVQEGLLAEVFSNEGIGTLVYANEYQAIRKAHKKDARTIYALIQGGMEADELLRRSRSELERQIEDFFVFEVDRNPVACAALHPYPEAKAAELAAVYVSPRYENQGIGSKLVAYAEAQARAAGVRKLIALSTQAGNFFVARGGFKLGCPDDLPPHRRETYDKSGRKSLVLVKML